MPWFHLRRGYAQWLTVYDASSEHDVGVGLREHFDPRKRWRSAIASARAVHRFGKHSRASSASSSASGGWGHDHRCSVEGVSSGVPSHDGSPTDVSESFTKLSLGSSDPGSHINVKITGPEEEETEEKDKIEVSSSDESLTGPGLAGLKDDADGETPLSAPTMSQVEHTSGQSIELEKTMSTSESVPAQDAALDNADKPQSQSVGSDESLDMPGTFHLSSVEKEGYRATRSPRILGQALRKLGLSM